MLREHFLQLRADLLRVGDSGNLCAQRANVLREHFLQLRPNLL